MMPSEPTLIEGGLSVDDRGQLAFVNGFTFEDVKRFYVLQNHTQGFIRAWHAHKKEGKYVFAVQGTALIGAVKINDFDRPNPNEEVQRFILSEKKPAVLWIPPGYANGGMSLTQDASIMYFSTATMEESRGDDFRYPTDFWKIYEKREVT